MGQDAATGRPGQRSGSEARKKQRRVTFRLTDAEHQELEAAAQSCGETVGTYIRTRVLKTPITGCRRRPTIEVQAITRLQGELNKIGSNIHQISRRINFGDTPERGAIQDAFAGYKEAISAIMTALNRGPR